MFGRKIAAFMKMQRTERRRLNERQWRKGERERERARERERRDAHTNCTGARVDNGEANISAGTGIWRPEKLSSFRSGDYEEVLFLE